MSLIVPTVTAENPHIYREEIERIADFAPRIHIDFSDGILAPNKLVKPVQAWWPIGLEVDLHIMFQNPETEIENIIALNPSLVILHVESKGEILDMIKELQSLDIKVGVALLEGSSPTKNKVLIENADHALIFGGKLGYHGGNAQLEHLSKVSQIKQINSEIELSWDGGINDKNALEISSAGIDVLNVGGYIQNSPDPKHAYDILMGKINA